MKHNNSIRFMFFLCAIIIVSVIFTENTLSMPESEIQRVTEQIKKQLNDKEPVFENIITTVYHTSSSKDFPAWTTNAANNYDVTTSLGWCVIPIPKRGFYEDIKCQGSGVHDERVYHTSTIKPTPQDSIPIDAKFTRGRTAKQTNPQAKWTIAVNNAAGTQCHIPYGTLVYIDFGDNNPWSGIYRAEDTGSAFRGQCKIDIYAGVGLDESKSAEQDVSRKKPKIYVLEPTDANAPHIMSETNLAENYKLLSKEEYSTKYGRNTIDQTKSALTTNRAGEIIMPYSYYKTLIGIKEFYDGIKKFSNEVLTTCSAESYEEKATCAYNLAKKYEEQGLLINHCSNNVPVPVTEQNFIVNNMINISGIIKSITMQVDEEGILVPRMSLQQLHGKKMEINVKNDDLSFLILQEEEYLEIKNAQIISNNPIILNITQKTEIIFQKDTKDWSDKENMNLIALKAADCSTKQNCICSVNIISSHNSYDLRFKSIIFQNEEVRTNTPLYGQNLNINDRIAPLQGMPMVLSQNSLAFYANPEWFLSEAKTNKETSLLNFKKTQNELIHIQENYEPSLSICELEKRYVVFCAEPTKGETYFEKNYYPKMNFTLKI